MWSHYADYHKGFCIGFDMQELAKSFDFIPSVVKYSPKFSKKDYCKDEIKAVNHWINTKHVNWTYEQEIRIRTNSGRVNFINGISSGLLKFDFGCIKEIYLGCNHDLKNSRLPEVYSKYKQENTKIKQVKKAKDSFALTEE